MDSNRSDTFRVQRAAVFPKGVNKAGVQPAGEERNPQGKTGARPSRLKGFGFREDVKTSRGSSLFVEYPKFGGRSDRFKVLDLDGKMKDPVEHLGIFRGHPVTGAPDQPRQHLRFHGFKTGRGII